MIIFTPFLETKDVLMRCRPDSYNFYEFNLSHPINHGLPLHSLIPNEQIPIEVLTGNSVNPGNDDLYYDLYFKYVFQSSPEAYISIMNIMLPLYNDPMACVLIYINHSEIRDIITECLSNLIQRRYGYSSYIINELEDIFCIKDDMTFNPRGIVAMQEDNERAQLMGYYGNIVPPEE